MSCRQIALLCGLLLMPASGSLFAQFNNNNNNNNNNRNFGGIIIDSDGVVATRVVRPEANSALKKKQAEFAQNNLPPEVIESTPSRALSLKTLEAKVAEILAAGGTVPEALQYLGGLQRIDQVVFDRENSDVFLVGPAEGFAPDNYGRMVGTGTGRPPIRLDDLVIALRTVLITGASPGCSIDPTPENMVRLQQFLSANSTASSTSVVSQRFQTMAQILGPQVVSVFGVPQDSHFALALVEADYRMKRISLGKEPSGVREIRSHLSLLAPQGNSLQRWWFVPLYEPLETNEDETVFVIKGQRTQLMAQEEISDASGRRADAFSTRRSTEQFAKLFTQHYAELADLSPPFAELQSLYDLALTATLIRTYRDRHLNGWQMSTFLREPRLPLERYPVPKSVRSEATSKKAGSVLVGLIGGVEMNVTPAVRNLRKAVQLPANPMPAQRTQGEWFWSAPAAGN